VQNLAPSAASRMGLSYEALHSQFEKLIVCNISGYGDEGPYKDKKAYDLLVQAEAGFLSITGTQESAAKSGISIADIAAGMQAHSAILAALILRANTGFGSKIDISMLEAMVEWMGYPLNYSYEGAEPPQRSGADHASIYPYGAFASGDNKAIMIGLQNEREWLDFCSIVLGDETLATDSRFEKNELRSSNRDVLKKIIESQFSKFSTAELKQKLDQASVAYADVNEMQDVWRHPQLRALKRMVETETPAGTVKSFLPPGNNNQFQPSLNAVPDIGEHSREILQGLGFSDEEIDSFYKDEIV
jgi:itaconate CoA-transferase